MFLRDIFSTILFCNFNKNLQGVMHTAKYAEVEPN